MSHKRFSPFVQVFNFKCVSYQFLYLSDFFRKYLSFPSLQIFVQKSSYTLLPSLCFLFICCIILLLSSLSLFCERAGVFTIHLFLYEPRPTNIKTTSLIHYHRINILNFHCILILILLLNYNKKAFYQIYFKSSSN